MSSERSITILVVDDNNHARSFVVDALRTAGFDVIEAATGAEGLRLASHGPDLIVLDVGLPDIDGRQVCRQIKDDPATASIPVVHISGMFQESLDRARALEDGADAYLPQPVTPEELVATVRTLLRAHRVEQESEERFRLLMDSAPILVSGFDAAGRVVLFNRACEELTGLRRDDVLGRSLAAEFLPVAWHPSLKNGDLALDPTPAETRWQSATGMERVIESQAFFIPAGNGRRTLVQVGRDVTERKQTEEALERRSAQAKSMVEVARAITSSLDLPAVLDLIVDRVRELLRIPRASIAVIEPEASDAVIRFVAYRGMRANFKELRPLHWRDGTTPTAILQQVAETAQAFCGSDVARIALREPSSGSLVFRYWVGPGPSGWVNAQIEPGRGIGGRAFAEGRPVRTENYLSDPDISKDYAPLAREDEVVAVLALPIRSEDSIEGVLYVANRSSRPFSDRDETILLQLADCAGTAIRNARLYDELREAHERLERSQAQLVQTERLRALGEMAAGVAHDFNNLLAVILGRAELLQRRATDPEVGRGLEAVRRAAQDGADTVRRIQEFTRTRQTRPFGRVDILSVVREVIELTRPRWKDEAQSQGIHYDVRVEGEPAAAEGRPEELREVFTNLLVNALEAMPGGGACRVRVRGDGDKITISVDDTGCGMSEETRRRVFEPFFTTKGARGNGLGLAVVWGIVQRHQGTIGVASTLGHGTTITVTLPVATSVVGDEELREPSAAPQDARVLVIDDEPEVRSIVADVLLDAGYTVVQATDGAEGLRRLEKERFDMVLSDVSMPGLSGWNVASECRAHFPHCRVGLVTGWGDQLDPELVASSGVAFVLAKPFEANEVVRQVTTALRVPVRPR